MQNNLKTDVLIIGGGVAGLISAIMASKNRKVTLLEKPSKLNILGKRILVSGNGRANFFNDDLFSSSFEKDYQFLFRNENNDYAKEFFSYLVKEGFAYTKEGKLFYPYFKRSECLHSFLLEKLKNVDVSYGLALKVNSIDNYVEVLIDGKKTQIYFNDLIISIGGRSYDREDYSYDLLKSLNVKYYPYQSMLAPIKTKEKIPSYLAKQRLRMKLSLFSEKNELYSEEGEILFKDDGLSGISVFNSTKYLLDEKRKNPTSSFTYKIDYAYDSLNENTSVSCYPSYLRKYILDNKLEKGKPLTFTFESLYPFKESQASYGGILLSELNRKTLSLSKYDHIYTIGEMLDVNLCCGGYNMGAALIEGYRVGKNL